MVYTRTVSPQVSMVSIPRFPPWFPRFERFLGRRARSFRFLETQPHKRIIERTIADQLVGDMKISLSKWAARNYDPPPYIGTLRAWAREGKIYPPAQKIGKAYYVDENAVHVSELETAPRLVHRLGLKKF